MSVSSNKRGVSLFWLCLVAAPVARAQSPVRLDGWCRGHHIALHRDGKSDDSPCVAAAVAYAESHDQPLYIPAGGPIVMAGASQVMLNNITLYGHDWQDRGATGQAPGRQGAVFWLTDRGRSPFLLGENSVTLEGLNFFWPDQSLATPVPVSYPALFRPIQPGGKTEAFKFRHGTVMNAYDFLDYHAGTIGNVEIAGSTIWAIHDAFQLYSVPEVFLVHDCLFSMAADRAQKTPLAAWYARNGTWLTAGGNGSDAAVSSVGVAMQAVNTYVYGARYGIHVLGGNGSAGNIYLGHAIGGGFDAVETVLQLDPDAAMGAFTFSDQYWYAAHYDAPATPIAHGAVYIPAANPHAATQITFSNLYVSAHGTMFDMPGTQGMGPIIHGVTGFICAGLADASCHFVIAGAHVLVRGNQITGIGTNTRNFGISVTGSAVISGNMFRNLVNSVRIVAPAFPVALTGNVSQGTTGQHDVTGALGANLAASGNAWSKP